MGARPPPAHDTEPGEWGHGWQHYAASASEYHFGKSVVFAQSCPAHSGPSPVSLRKRLFALAVTAAIPEFKIDLVLFRVLVLERLRVPLLVTKARCECGAAWIPRAATGQRHTLEDSARERLHQNGTLARVCREAGASVRCNAKLVDMNVAVRANDERAVEVLASGLPLFHGAQLAVDTTLRCALTTSGTPRPGAAALDGIVCAAARADKELKYSELLSGDRCRLVVVAMEDWGMMEPRSS